MAAIISAKPSSAPIETPATAPRESCDEVSDASGTPVDAAEVVVDDDTATVEDSAACED
jgi:hypothetical protein